MSETIDLETLRQQRRETETPNAPPPRHSQRTGLRAYVISMKVLLPILALILIALVVVLPQLREIEGEFSFGLSLLSQEEDLRSTTVLGARFEGTDRNDRPYTITASSAEERHDDDEAIDLSDLEADITMVDGTWVAVTAEEGTYLKTDQSLTLRGAVNLFQDQGYELQTETARIDLSSGDVTSEDRVLGQGPFGTIESDGLEVREAGQIVRFTGATELNLVPGASGGLQ